MADNIENMFPAFETHVEYMVNRHYISPGTYTISQINGNTHNLEVESKEDLYNKILSVVRRDVSSMTISSIKLQGE